MRVLAYLYLRLRGWRFDGSRPTAPKVIVIGAPHTSNWDFVVFLAALHRYRIRARFIGKHTLFRWPLGWLMGPLGGIPVRRSDAAAVVSDVVAAFAATDEMALVLAPEGTRSAAEYWKSGFYRMARDAEVPIVLAGMDYGRRRISLGDAFSLTGDVGADMDRIRAFFSGMTGCRPDGFGPIRLREETA